MQNGDEGERLRRGLRHHTIEDQDQETQPHRVLLLNDDYTPMEFVVHVLERFFQKDREAATRIMLHVHNHGGESVVSIHSRPRPGSQVMDFARRISIRCNA